MMKMKKIKLLIKQWYKCNIYNCIIEEVDAHMDYIIIFEMVGDVLKDKFQLLC